MKAITNHILLPVIPAVIFFIIASTPVEAMSSYGRGFAAVFTAIVSSLAGLAFAIQGIRKKLTDEPDSYLCIISSIILAIPALFTFILV